jgi:hypothetical protein
MLRKQNSQMSSTQSQPPLAARLAAFRSSKTGTTLAPGVTDMPPQDLFLTNCQEMLWHKRVSWRAEDRRLYISREKHADKETSLYYWGVNLAPTSDGSAIAKLHLLITFDEGDARILRSAREVAKAIKAGTWGATDIAKLRALRPIVRDLDNHCWDHGCPTYRTLMLDQTIAYLTRPKLIGGGGDGRSPSSRPAVLRLSVVGKVA